MLVESRPVLHQSYRSLRQEIIISVVKSLEGPVVKLEKACVTSCQLVYL